MSWCITRLDNGHVLAFQDDRQFSETQDECFPVTIPRSSVASVSLRVFDKRQYSAYFTWLSRDSHKKYKKLDFINEEFFKRVLNVFEGHLELFKEIADNMMLSTSDQAVADKVIKDLEALRAECANYDEFNSLIDVIKKWPHLSLMCSLNLVEKIGHIIRIVGGVKNFILFTACMRWLFFADTINEMKFFATPNIEEKIQDLMEICGDFQTMMDILHEFYYKYERNIEFFTRSETALKDFKKLMQKSGIGNVALFLRDEHGIEKLKEELKVIIKLCYDMSGFIRCFFHYKYLDELYMPNSVIERNVRTLVARMGQTSVDGDIYDAEDVRFMVAFDADSFRPVIEDSMIRAIFPKFVDQPITEFLYEFWRALACYHRGDSLNAQKGRLSQHMINRRCENRMFDDHGHLNLRQMSMRMDEAAEAFQGVDNFTELMQFTTLWPLLLNNYKSMKIAMLCRGGFAAFYSYLKTLNKEGIFALFTMQFSEQDTQEEIKEKLEELQSGKSKKRGDDVDDGMEVLDKQMDRLTAGDRDMKDEDTPQQKEELAVTVALKRGRAGPLEEEDKQSAIPKPVLEHDMQVDENTNGKRDRDEVYASDSEEES
jgi:hypothetical protein